MKFNTKLTFEDHVHGMASRVSQRIGILRLVKRVFVDIIIIIKTSSTGPSRKN